MTDPQGPDLLDAVRRLDEAAGMFAPDEKVVVAVSGGPDSVALLDVLCRYAPGRPLRLHACHLDHLMRPESSDDAAFVSRLAQQLDVPCTLAAEDVPSLAAERGRGLEEAARAARYGFLATVARRETASAIAVAHTSDDQAETVLINLLRGSGLRGLKGMSPVSRTPYGATGPRHDGPEAEANETTKPTVPSRDAGADRPRLLRPLLDVDRAGVLAYLAYRDLPYISDESNFDPRFLRNRVRHEIIPLLETVNPALRASLARTARSIADDLAFIDVSVDHAWRDRVTVRDGERGRILGESPGEHELDRVATNGRRVEIRLEGWSEQHVAVQRRLIRRGVGVLRGRRDLEWRHVESLRELLDTGAQGSLLTLPGGLTADRQRDLLTLRLQSSRVPPPVARMEELQLEIPGETSLPGGWRVDAEIRDVQPDDSSRTADIWAARIDADAAGARPTVRFRRSGDRLQPLGMGGRHKSLQDLFVDARVPRDERDAWPIVVRGSTVLWVPGVRLSQQARVTDATRRVLCLTVLPPEHVSRPD